MRQPKKNGLSDSGCVNVPRCLLDVLPIVQILGRGAHVRRQGERGGQPTQNLHKGQHGGGWGASRKKRKKTALPEADAQAERPARRARPTGARGTASPGGRRPRGLAGRGGVGAPPRRRELRHAARERGHPKAARVGRAGRGLMIAKVIMAGPTCGHRAAHGLKRPGAEPHAAQVRPEARRAHAEA